MSPDCCSSQLSRRMYHINPQSYLHFHALSIISCVKVGVYQSMISIHFETEEGTSEGLSVCVCVSNYSYARVCELGE